MNEPWQSMLSDEQRRLFNAACGDLASQIVWHGQRLSKDDWRHLISGTVLGWRMLPAIDMGTGAAGFVMLGGSSLNLHKAECTDAITMAFHIGDDPSSQGLNSSPVRWCQVIRAARGISDADDDMAQRFAA
jgi:NinB protein